MAEWKICEEHDGPDVTLAVMIGARFERTHEEVHARWRVWRAYDETGNVSKTSSVEHPWQWRCNAARWFLWERGYKYNHITEKLEPRDG